jgi:hypothetical protein
LGGDQGALSYALWRQVLEVHLALVQMEHHMKQHHSHILAEFRIMDKAAAG